MAELNDIRETVRERYAAAAAAAHGADERARAREPECGCCGPDALTCTPDGGFGRALYDGEAGAQVPEAALAVSLGCGVPTAVADLHAGETVLDLGSGAGADVLISARRVGATGKAIGLDMTDEMLALARANAAEAGVDNVEFLKGYLEDMPLADHTVDVIISNCVINLSGDKGQTLREAARVLRPGGRLAISDVIADPGMDEATRADMAAWTGCVAGALTEGEFRAALRGAGFDEIEIRETHRVHQHAGAAIIRARKPQTPGYGDDYARATACKLETVELEAQLERYRELGRHATSVTRRPGELLVRFAGDLPPGLLERTVEVEQACCAFLRTDYDEHDRSLTIASAAASADATLETLFDALTAAEDAPAESCCTPSAFSSCCEPGDKQACCGTSATSAAGAPSSCACST